MHGAEQPHWPCGPFKIRLPFIHYRWETAEMLQALIMFVKPGSDEHIRPVEFS